MSTLMLSAKLDRSDSGTPWGFRMHGGKDFGCPLTIQRVTPGSLAAKCGLQVGDVILRIGDVPVDALVHKEAQGRIIQSANFLELTLQRRGSASEVPYDDPTTMKTSPGSPHGHRPSGRAYSPSPLATGQPAFVQPSGPGSQDYNRSAQPFHGQGNVPVAVNNQYNTPVNMYSVDNAMGTLAAQTGALNLGGPSQGTDHSVGISPSHGVISGSSPQHGMTHASPHLSENTTKPKPPQLHFTDAYKPPIESWTVAENNSPTSGSPKSPNEHDHGGPHKLPRAPRRTTPPSPGSRPGFHRKVTPVPQDVNPARKGLMSSRFEEVNEGEEMRYHGYTNPSMQSQSFKLLQEKLDKGEEPPSLGTIGGGPSPRPPSPEEPPQTVRSSPFRPVAAAPSSRQYNSPVGLYGKTLESPANGGHCASIEEGPEEEDMVNSGTKTTPYQASPEFSSPSSSSSMRGPKPWGAKDHTTPQYRKISAPRLITQDNGKTPPSSQPVSVATEPSPFNKSENTSVVIDKPASTYISAKLDKSPIGHVKNNSHSTPSSGAHGSEVAPDTRGTPPEIMPSSARWLLGGLTAAGAGIEKTKEKPVVTCGTGVTAVMDSDSVQYVEVKVYPSPKTASTSGAPAGRPISPARAASPRGVWQPSVPTGPRKMRSFLPGSAKSMPGVTSGVKVPICDNCGIAIRGPFVLALDKSWCPDHFNCSNPHCKVPLIGIGFVEEGGQLFCEKDYEKYFAPRCGKCGNAIMRECVNALKDTFHPECFLCFHCNKPIGSGSFHIEDGKNYCEKDWQAMFQTKCYGCQFPIEPGDRWVEALNQNWHSECFNCSTCQVNLEGQGYFAKQGKPYCKKHAARF